MLQGGAWGLKFIIRSESQYPIIFGRAKDLLEAQNTAGFSEPAADGNRVRTDTNEDIRGSDILQDV
jgi:hypothetical protein